MPLDFSPIQFPWEMFTQAQQMKNQNFQNLRQSFSDIGSGAGNIVGSYAKYRGLQALKRALDAQRGTGQPLDTAALLPSLVAASPDAGIKILGDYLNPTTQADIAYKKSETAKNALETSTGLPATLAQQAETARRDREAAALREQQIKWQNQQADLARQERERVARESQIGKLRENQQAIYKNNFFTTHLLPGTYQADRDINAISEQIRRIQDGTPDISTIPQGGAGVPVAQGLQQIPRVQKGTRKLIGGVLYENKTGDPATGWHKVKP